MTDEIVALVDHDGHVVGSAPRSVVRRDNLLHSATAVLVRDPARRIYVHRRSDTKDWAPGCWDVAAGGVIVVGEEPLASARRELEEELGVVVDTLLELGNHLYEDDTTRCFEYAYEAVWDGPVRHQPEEVVEGRWVAAPELAAMLSDPAILFVPDSRQLLDRLAPVVSPTTPTSSSGTDDPFVSGGSPQVGLASRSRGTGDTPWKQRSTSKQRSTATKPSAQWTPRVR